MNNSGGAVRQTAPFSVAEQDAPEIGGLKNIMGHEDSPSAGWRQKLGLWMFTIPFVMFFGAPIIVPFVVSSADEAAAAIGAVIVAAELIWFASIPLLGLQGFKELKAKAFGRLALPDGPVAPERTRFGAKLFCFGFCIQQLVLLWLLVGSLSASDEELSQGLLGLTLVQEAFGVTVAIIVGAIALVASLYVMGMPFIRGLMDVLGGRSATEESH